MLINSAMIKNIMAIFFMTMAIQLVAYNRAQASELVNVMQLNEQSEQVLKKSADAMSDTFRSFTYPPTDELSDIENEIIDFYTAQLNHYVATEVIDDKVRAKIRDKQISLIESSFTQAERQYMLDFYQTAIGQSILSKKVDFDLEQSETQIITTDNEIDKIMDRFNKKSSKLIE